MKNKEILRRTTAFISALSIVYATTIAQTDGVLVKGAETTTVTKQSETQSVVTTSETASADTTVPVLVTTEPETSSSSDITSTAPVSDTEEQTTEATEVTTVTTEEETTTTVPVFSHDFTMTFDNNIDDSSVKDLASKICGAGASDIKVTSNGEKSEFICSFKSVNTDFDLVSALKNCNAFEVKNNTPYLKNGRDDNLQYFSYSAKGSKVDFFACYYFVVDGESKTLNCPEDGVLETDDKGITLSGAVFKSGNTIFIEKGLYLTITAKDGYKPEYKQVSIPGVSPNNDKNNFISCKVSEDSKNYTVSLDVKKNSDVVSPLIVQKFEKPILKIERNEVKGIGLKIDNQNYNSKNTLSWYEENGNNLQISVNSDYAFDLLAVKKDSSGNVTETETLGENLESYDKNVFKESELLNKYKYDSSVILKIDAFIKHQKYDVYLDDVKKDARGDYKVYKENNNRYIDIPYFEIVNDDTYVLNEIKFDDNNELNDLLSLDKVLENNMTNYRFTYDKEADHVTGLYYKKIDKAGSNISSCGTLRNSESRTLSKTGGRYNVYSIGTKSKNEDYYIMYRYSNDILHRFFNTKGLSSSYDFEVQIRDSAVQYIVIDHVFKRSGNDITEIELNHSDKLFYLDNTAPDVPKDLMTMSQGSEKNEKLNSVSKINEESIWYNSSINLDVFISDKTTGVTDNDIRTRLDTISGSSSEITSIVISDEEPSEGNTYSRKAEFFSFSKNKKGSWIKDQHTQRSMNIDFAYDESNGYTYSPVADTNQNGYTFSFVITPLQKQSNINKKMYVTVWDINGNMTTTEMTVRYDGMAPSASDVQLSELQKNKAGKYVVLKDKNKQFVLNASVSADDNLNKDPKELSYEIFDSTVKSRIFSENQSETDSDSQTLSEVDGAELADSINGSVETSEINSVEKLNISDEFEVVEMTDSTQTLRLSESLLKDVSGSGVAYVTVEYIYNGQKETVTITNNTDNVFEGAISLNDKIKNTSGIIKVTTTDFAGNASSVYYLNSGAPVSGQTGASEIIFDSASPNCSINNESVPDFGGNWFRNFPDGIVVDFDDVKAEAGFSNSGIASLEISLLVKEGEEKTYFSDLPVSVLSSNKGSLIFVPSEDKSEFTVSLECNGSSVELFDGKTIKFPDDNKFTVYAAAVDYAGNRSDSKSKSTITFNVDKTAPVFGSKFEIAEDVLNTSFGTFSKNAVTVRVSMIEDFEGSGIEKDNIVLYHGSSTYTASKLEKIEETDDQWICEFSVPGKDIGTTVFDGTLAVSGTDNVGNHSGKTSLYSGSSDSLIIERIPPVIEFDKEKIKASDPDFVLKKYIEKSTDANKPDKLWFNGDVDLQFDVTDENSGIAEVSTRIIYFEENKNSGIDFFNGGDIFSDESVLLKSKSYVLSTKNDKYEDGCFEFIIASLDNSGNESKEERFKVYKDITAPLITRFEYSTEPENRDSNISDDRHVDLTSLANYRHFSNTKEKITVRVYAEDSGASSGIKTITLKRTGAAAEEKEVVIDPEKGAYAEFEIPNDFKGTLYAKAEDNVGNTPDFWAQSNGYINETEEKHKEEETPYSIDIPNTSYTDIFGNKLYKENFDAVVKIRDTFSGIRSVDVISPGNSENANLETSIDDPEKNMTNWNSDSTDLNLQTQISRKVSQILDSQTNKNGNEIIVKATDNAGNPFETESVLYSFDNSDPEISVSFDNNSADSQFTNYYKAPRQATVTIKERNFDPSRISSSASFSGGWTLVRGEKGIEGSEYQNTVNFASDGVYTLKVECSDMADNNAVPFDSNEFIVDMTAPVISVSFDNNNSENSGYYNQNRTAFIEVNDVNFESSRVSITGTKDSGTEGFPVKNGSIDGVSLAWQNIGGNVWRTSVPITEDGYYEFNVTAQDKAGNSAQPYHTSFHIDKASPEINITGAEDSHAYNDEFRPVIEINDRNIDFDSVSISMTGSKNSDKVKLEGTVEKTDSKYVFTANDIAHVKENDDIYTINVNANDKSGNPSVKSIKVSVNRFGSTFEPDEYAASIKDQSVKEVKDIIIHEINPDKHPDGFKPSVRLIKDGSNKVLDDSDAGLDIELSNDSKTGWYDYTYTIKASNFENDGVYEIMIYTEDKASNKNYSESLLSFKVDKTSPEIYYLNVESKGVYKGESKLVSAALTDNLGIDPDSISVLVNGKELDKSEITFDADKNICSFNLFNQNFNQKIEVLACDKAGNSLDPAQAQISDIFVSTSTAQILFHKTWFKITLAAAAALAAAGSVILVVKKKKKS